jgi:TolB protein
MNIRRRRILEIGVAAIAGAIVRGQVLAQAARLTLAVTDFIPGTPEDREIAHYVTRVIAGDLERGGRFVLTGPGTVAGVNADTMRHFGDWRAVNAQGLVTGRVATAAVADDRLRVEFRLWEVAAGSFWASNIFCHAPMGGAWRILSPTLSTNG